MAFYNYIYPNCTSLIDSSGQVTATKEQLEAFINNKANFPIASGTVDQKTVSKYQWRVAPTSNDNKDYIPYDFDRGNESQARSALKRALARARLETYALPTNGAAAAHGGASELIAFYHFIGNETVGGKEYYKFRFDINLSNGTEPDAYAGWTFNKKIELGTSTFGTTAKVQHSYDHAEIAGFYYPTHRYKLIDGEVKELEFDPEDYEQVIIKTLTCFDLGLLDAPILDKGTSIYYHFNKFSGEWEEVDDLYIKQNGIMVNLRNMTGTNQELVSYTNPHGESEPVIYKPIKLVNW